MSDNNPDAPARYQAGSRRAFVVGGAGAIAAVAVQAVALPRPVAAASIQLGQTNSSTKSTTIRNTAGGNNPKGLIGRITDTTPGALSAGLQGINNGTNASGVVGTANRGPAAFGVWGTSTTGVGVSGVGSVGVLGTSGASESAGVIGIAVGEAWDGVAGDGPSGVYGYSDWSDGYGIDGYAAEGAFAGVYGEAYDGWAGYFAGDVYVEGDVYYPAATLRVDHPEAPAERWYQRSIVGAFEQVTVISGNATTGPDGTVRVRVPELFARMHKDFRYQLTPLGKATGLHVAKKMRENGFVVAAEEGGLEVSWQVTGVRDDPGAKAFRPDVAKEAAERGRFAQPALYGRPKSRGLAPMRSRARKPASVGRRGPDKTPESE